jgi:hypothetical protein
MVMALIDSLMAGFDDVVLMYVPVSEDKTTTCGDFLIDEGLFDRDLGLNS